MALLRRINPFWLGAGFFLTLFCTNEIVAHHLSRVPRWLGGPLVYGAAWFGALVGVAVMAFLGIEEPREAAPAAAPVTPAARAERASEPEAAESEA